MTNDLFLAFSAVGLLFCAYAIPWILTKRSELNIKSNELYRREQVISRRESESKSKLDDFDAALKEVQEKENSFQKMFKECTADAPWLASLWAEFEDYKDQRREDELRYKPRPAIKAADELKAIRAEKRALVEENRLMKHQLIFLKEQFPQSVDYMDLTLEDIHAAATSVEDESDFRTEYDSLRRWLSESEYHALSDAQRYQLALDRYRTHTNWEAGRAYERYIGYLHESKGATVKYNGATEGLNDMGRDLIVRSGDHVKIIQCKRLSKSKNRVIHENIVFQLHGSCVQYYLEHPGSKVTGAIYTTTMLSDVARSCAKAMGIEVHEDFPLCPYPMVKCNIGNDGIKRFHLPFSQMYDRLHISPAKGDFYAFTVQEAMDAGFVKAKRWTGNQ